MLPVTVTPENKTVLDSNRNLHELAETQSPEFIDYTLARFLKSFNDDQCSLELLLYFGRHPLTRFNQPVVLSCLGSVRPDVERALRRLLLKKLVVRFMENGVALFGLTHDEYVRNMITGMGRLDHSQWQRLLKQVEKEHLAT
jgi:hypothetical protein